MYRCFIIHLLLGKGVQTLFAIIGLLLGICKTQADDAALVGPNEVWRYRKFPPGQTLPPTREWVQRKFNDTEWQRTRSGLELPEHDLTDHIRSPAGTGPTKSGYFVMRKSFAAPHRDRIHSLWLTVEHELGFVAYLNGVEIGRSRDRGAIFPSPAERARGGEPRVFPVILDVSRFRHLLDDEENVLVLEGASSGESDSILPASASVVINFPHGPMLTPTTNSVQISWSTLTLPPGDSSVDFGLTPALGWTVSNSTPVVNHFIELTNLAPDTVYYYRIATFTRDSLLTSTTNSFRTLKMSGPVNFVVVGDTGTGSQQQGQLAQVMRNLNPDLVLHVGDIIYGGFNEFTAISRYFLYYREQLKTTPFFLAVGNHDIGCCGDETPDFNATNWVLTATNFQNTFCLPTNNATGTEHFYSFDHGDVHFVCLYQPWGLNGPDFDYTQLTWLTNDLATSSNSWKVMFFHRPIANSGLHGTSAAMMETFVPLAEQFGVHMIFAGHDHNLQRFAPTNGVHHMVTGGGGAGTYSLSLLHPASAQFLSVNHCTSVRVERDTMLVEAVGLDGKVFDRMVIHRSPTPNHIYQASWNTPTVETSPANDLDGNILGQTFDLVGEPILTKTGRSSNLGRFLVNNDWDYLHVGIESPMFYRGNSIFLFIETPGLVGVTNMAGLGNGIIDPEGEGADGLDFLENLSFANFTPAIGCILGDEYADGQFRSFHPRSALLNVGQGAFRLDSALTSIGGVKLQQFNLSPQFSSVRDDDNANLIELTLPLMELGVGPGDEIKLAAVIGETMFDTNAQTRCLDSSGLAIYQSGSGIEPVVISGVRVRLATLPNIDSDDDGLLDAWETRYGLNPNAGEGNDGPDGDPDADGMVNGAEQIAGTNPTDPNSVLKLSLKVVGPQRFELSWSSIPNYKYHVEYAENQLTNYSLLSGPDWPRLALSTNETVIDDRTDAPATTIQRTYRLRLVP